MRGRRATARARHQRFWGFTSLLCAFCAFALLFGGAMFADAAMRTHAIVCWYGCAAMMFGSLASWIVATEMT